MSRQTGQQRQQNQQNGQPKRNRITLAVRQHTPAPTPLGQLESVPAPLPQAITQPISVPLQMQAGPPPAQDAASASQNHRFASLMAEVAAERQQQLVAQQQPKLSEDSESGDNQASALPRLPLASVPSPIAVQVIAPPPAAPQSFASELLAPVENGGQVAPTSHSQLEPSAGPPARGHAPVTHQSFGDQPEEQIEAPSFQHVLSQGCPRKGVFSWENKDHCDRYYMCTNGTFTEESCPNGLLYSQMGAVYQHCAYNWNIDCGRKKAPGPLASPGCPWQFGIFPTSQQSQCSLDYYICEWGVPEKKRCSPEGLFYDDRIKGCQWPDQLGCKSEALLNFKCPAEDEDNPYWPYPRYYHTKQDIIVCVNEQPRLVHCTEEQVVEPSSLSCLDLKKNKNKKPRT